MAGLVAVMIDPTGMDVIRQIFDDAGEAWLRSKIDNETDDEVAGWLRGKTLSEVTVRAIEVALESSPTRSEAARRLGISRPTLLRWIRQHNLAPIRGAPRALAKAKETDRDE
jgi:transcriptional regulator with PAS, ATPase and Fis domain